MTTTRMRGKALIFIKLLHRVEAVVENWNYPCLGRQYARVIIQFFCHSETVPLGAGRGETTTEIERRVKRRITNENNDCVIGLMQKSRKAVSRTQFLYFFILFFSLYDSNFFGSVPHKGKRDLNTCKDINGNIANVKMWNVLVFSSPFLSFRFEHFFSCLAYFFLLFH